MRDPAGNLNGTASGLIFSKNIWWTSGAVVVSLLVCSAIARMYVEESRMLRQTTSLTDRLGQARIELAKGFLHFALGGEPLSPFDRDRGVALLRQAATSLEQDIIATGANGSDIIPDAERSFGEFRNSVADFQLRLDKWLEKRGREPGSEAGLLTAFSELERRAEILDNQILRNLQLRSARLDRTFRYTLFAAVLLLSGICLAVFFMEKAQRKSSTALLESEGRLRTLVDTIPDLVWLKDPYGVYLSCNSTFERFFGSKEEDIVGKTDYDFVDRNLADFFRERDGKAVEAGNPTVNEEWLTFRDSGYHGLFETIKTPMYDTKRKLLGVLGIARDISERKKNEEALRESEERLRIAQDAAKAGSWEWDLQTNRNTWSDELWDLYGLEAHSCEPSYEAWLGTIHPEDRASVEGIVREAGLKGTELNAEWRVFDPDGSERWLMSRGRPIYDKEGRAVRYVGIAIDITERKQVEHALQESEERLRLFIEHAPAALAMFDRDMRYLAVSNRWVADFRLGGGDFVGRSHYEIFPGIPDRWKMAHRRGMAGEVLSVEEDCFERPDGSTQWLRWELRPWYTTTGTIGGIVISSEDITKNKHSEEALRESEERFRQVAESVGDWIWEVDETGLYRYCSPAVEKILLYSKEELEGQAYFFDLFLPEVREDLKQQALGIFARKEQFRDFVNYNIRKDGKIAILETRAVPMLDGDGNLRGYRGVDRDITEQRRMLETQKMLATALEQGADAVVVTDVAGNIEYVNSAFEQSTGYMREEVLGKNPRLLKSGVHSDAFYSDLWTTVTSGKVWRSRMVNRRKDATTMVCQSVIAPVRDEKGNIIRYVGVNRDMTESELLQERLAQSQKMEAIGTLAGGIAHDFNNMLFAMTGFTELAMESLPRDSDIHADLERVLDAGKRAGQMVKQILTFSRHATPEKSPLDLSPIVKEGLKFLRASIPSTIEIRQNVHQNPGRVFGDPTQIHQILMNFCTNAAHAMRDTKGVLSVELAGMELDGEDTALYPDLVPGKYVRLTVTDTGHGIPPELRDRIFDPFFTTKAMGEGTGLGLSVVHGIVKAHGGSISFYSEVDKGTTFHVYLPVIEEERPEEDKVRTDWTPTGNERVLFVDDEPLLAEMGLRILEPLGYRVEVKTSPIPALESFRSNPQHFDLVITDLTMPKMTGKELASELRKIRPDIPIILCTGFNESLGDESLKEAGIAALLGKPILKRQIAKTVREVLDGERIT